MKKNESIVGEGDFNPRSREGSDEVLFVEFCKHFISIHAPARGATKALRRKGGNLRFQSTLPRGERLASGSKTATLSSNFNPRSREGSDSKLQPFTI